jgi:hypothetical protein
MRLPLKIPLLEEPLLRYPEPECEDQAEQADEPDGHSKGTEQFNQFF